MKLSAVEVRRRVLWIDSDAYPLQNITRVQARELALVRKSPVAPWLKSIVRWIVLGTIAAVVMKLADVEHPSYYTWLWLVVLAPLVISTMQLIIALRKKKTTYYSLVIEMAGTPCTALISTDRMFVNHLVSTIMQAIDDDTVTFSQSVMNYNPGDAINQYGDQNIGKVVEGATSPRPAPEPAWTRKQRALEREDLSPLGEFR